MINKFYIRDINNSMKKLNFLLLSLILIILISCSGSDTYRGKWKGMTLEGNKVEIIFKANKMILKDNSFKDVVHNYNQNSVNIENSIESYGIEIEDGRRYYIVFPIRNNEDIGLILDENKNLLYSISRKEYINSKEIFKLN